MKVKLLFLLKLLGISLVLFVFLGWIEQGYQIILLLGLSFILLFEHLVFSEKYNQLKPEYYKKNKELRTIRTGLLKEINFLQGVKNEIKVANSYEEVYNAKEK